MADAVDHRWRFFLSYGELSKRLEAAQAVAQCEVQTRPRQRPVNVKQQVVERREFEDIRLDEYVGEFAYPPTLCHTTYRVVVV